MADNASVIDEASFMDLLMNGLIDRVDALESKVELLEGKFDVWQGMINPILSSIEISLQRDSNLITILVFISTIIIVVATAGITYFLSRDKKQTLKNAIADIDKKIAEGIFSETPEVRSKIINVIIESDEFRLASRGILDYFNKSKDVDSERVNEKQPVENPTIPPDMK